MSRRAAYTKKQSEGIHAKRRAFERYGLILNRRALWEIGERVRRGDVVKSWRQSCTRQKVVMEVGGVAVLLVYDKPRRQVITFLPMWRTAHNLAPPVQPDKYPPVAHAE